MLAHLVLLYYRLLLQLWNTGVPGRDLVGTGERTQSRGTTELSKSICEFSTKVKEKWSFLGLFSRTWYTSQAGRTLPNHTSTVTQREVKTQTQTIRIYTGRTQTVPAGDQVKRLADGFPVWSHFDVFMIREAK